MLMTRKKKIESMPLLIKNINNTITRKIFHGIVLVTYRTYLDKRENSKAIFNANLIDSKAKWQ